MLIVDLHYPNPAQLGTFMPILEAKDAFIRHGIHLRDRRNMPFDVHNAHLIITHQETLNEHNVNISVPIILAERLDCATFNARTLAEHPNVKMIFKIATMRPPEIQNVHKGRYHSYLLHKQRSIPKQLSAETLLKIHPAPNYSTFTSLNPLAEATVDLSAPRPIDVHFRGTVQYGDPDPEKAHREHKAITDHRTKALEIVASMPNNASSSKQISREEYFDELLHTKVVVSPWGFGELCWRDAEAMFAGCVLVKPNSDYVLTWPDMFTRETYVACQQDLSDLKETVQRVLDNWDSFTEMRRRNKEMLLTYRTKESIATHYGELMRRCLAK